MGYTFYIGVGVPGHLSGTSSGGYQLYGGRTPGGGGALPL